MARIRLIVMLIIISVAVIGCGFAGFTRTYDPPGFLYGIWHGLIAPWTLIVRFWLDIQMYAIPNSGWFYDCGFLLGIAGSLPIGWIAALIQVGLHLLA